MHVLRFLRLNELTVNMDTVFKPQHVVSIFYQGTYLSRVIKSNIYGKRIAVAMSSEEIYSKYLHCEEEENIALNWSG